MLHVNSPLSCVDGNEEQDCDEDVWKKGANGCTNCVALEKSNTSMVIINLEHVMMQVLELTLMLCCSMSKWES